ncbi:MAG: cobyrinic acid a,c-diamide synthase [Clostridia bacterium]|nr:cobyrinic acid a,c-diamide synthase [Clostridia bacterium]
MNFKRIIIAGTRSGVGKTTISTGIMAALSNMGLKVQGFKVGPDYIDPSYHVLATGRSSRNLDTFLLSPEMVLEVFEKTASQAYIAVVEGVMGLYDGRKGSGFNSSSTAGIARLLAAPVLLIVDATSIGQSVAAEVLGYKALDPKVNLAGVILNKVSSDSHFELLRETIEDKTGIPVVGCFKRGALPTFPSRHLGLIPAVEQQGLKNIIEELAAVITANIDLAKIIKIATTDMPFSIRPSKYFIEAKAQFHEKIPIAVARDAAFNFYYQDSLEYLEALGAELIPFSPLEDTYLPEKISAVYIGGGFPEIFLEKLAANKPILEDLRRRVINGMPVYAECGGLMYLTQQITDLDGCNWPMAGIIPASCIMQNKLVGLGYREAILLNNNLFGNKGDKVKGHEFHYSALIKDKNDLSAAYIWKVNGSVRYDGYASNNVLASYLHLHFLGNQKAAKNFLKACKDYSRR